MINISLRLQRAEGDKPFSIDLDATSCRGTSHRLLRIGLKGREVANEKRPRAPGVYPRCLGLDDAVGAVAAGEAAMRLFVDK